MKTRNLYHRQFLIVISAVITSLTTLQAQDVKEDADSMVRNLIESKQYVFNAESVLPSNGRLRLLNSGERLDLRGDTLIADLPYFGRSYTAPIDPSQGGFHFTSSDFEYTVKEKKKGGWNINIKPRDNNDVRQFTLDVSTNATASLQVVSNNRQFISFNGRLSPKSKK